MEAILSEPAVVLPQEIVEETQISKSAKDEKQKNKGKQSWGNVLNRHQKIVYLLLF